MAEQDGVGRVIKLAEVTVADTRPVPAAVSEIISRTTWEVTPSKDLLTNPTKRTDRQSDADRHGTRRTSGPWNAKLSPSTFRTPIQAIARRDYAAVANIATGGLTASSATKTLTSVNDVLAGGLRRGMTVRLINMTTAGIDALNLTVTSIAANGLTFTVAQEIPDDAGPNATAEIVIPGLQTFVPSTGHTSKLFMYEDYRPDMDVEESILHDFFTFGQWTGDLSPTDTFDTTFNGSGRDFAVLDGTTVPPITATQGYLTGATAPDLRDVFGGSDLTVIYNGVAYCDVTALNWDINWNLSTTDTFCGPIIKHGRLSASGQFTVVLSDGQFVRDFDQENERPLTLLMESVERDATSNAKEFKTIHFPRVKSNDNSVDDSDGVLIATVPFSAYVFKDTTSTQDFLTTFMTQDSTLV